MVLRDEYATLASSRGKVGKDSLGAEDGDEGSSVASTDSEAFQVSLSSDGSAGWSPTRGEEGGWKLSPTKDSSFIGSKLTPVPPSANSFTLRTGVKVQDGDQAWWR